MDATSFLSGWVARCAERLDAEVDRLTELDAARGDADHGVNMQRGFTAAARAVADERPASAQAVLLTASTAVRRSIGGTSGPLWAVALRRMGKTAGDATAIDAALLADMLGAAVAGVGELGGAAVGEGTMLDALAPAGAALHAAQGSFDEALAAAADAADAGARQTAERAATKGRASYVGERGIGTPDPGAVSAALLVACFLDGPTRHA